jgi:hypothetical protein
MSAAKAKKKSVPLSTSLGTPQAMTLLQQFVARLTTASTTITSLTSAVQIPTKMIQAVKWHYQPANKPNLIILPLDVKHVTNLINSPITIIYEHTHLQYIQLFDNLHDFGSYYATDIIKKPKYTDEYFLQFMVFSYIKMGSFKQIPFPPFVIPGVNYTLPIEIKPYSGFCGPGIGKMTKSVDEIEAYMLLLALKNSTKTSNGGTYEYVEYAAANHNSIWNFFNDYRDTDTTINLIIDTPMDIPNIIRRGPYGTSGANTSPLFKYLLTQEGAYDPAPSKTTPNSSKKNVDLYNTNILVEHPFNAQRIYLKYPNLPTQVDPTKIYFNSTYDICFRGMGWQNGSFSSIISFKDSSVTPVVYKHIGCICNQKNHPICVPIINKNIKFHTTPNITLSGSTTNPIEKSLRDQLNDVNFDIDKIYDKFNKCCSSTSASFHDQMKDLIENINFNFTLKRAGDGLQAKCVEYINKKGMYFIKRKVGNVGSKENDFFETAGGANPTIPAIWINKAILITLDRVLAAYAIYNRIPVIYSASKDFILMYKPAPNTFTPVPNPNIQSIINATKNTINLKANNNYTIVVELQKLNSPSTPKYWFGLSPFISSKVTPPPSGTAKPKKSLLSAFTSLFSSSTPTVHPIVTSFMSAPAVFGGAPLKIGGIGPELEPTSTSELSQGPSVLPVLEQPASLTGRELTLEEEINAQVGMFASIPEEEMERQIDELSEITKLNVEEKKELDLLHIQNSLYDPYTILKILPKLILYFSGTPMKMGAKNTHKNVFIHYLQNIKIQEPLVVDENDDESKKDEESEVMEDDIDIEYKNLLSHFKPRVIDIKPDILQEPIEVESDISFDNTEAQLPIYVEESKEPEIQEVAVEELARGEAASEEKTSELLVDETSSEDKKITKLMENTITDFNIYLPSKLADISEYNNRTHFEDNFVTDYNSSDDISIEGGEPSKTFIQCIYEKSYIDKINKLSHFTDIDTHKNTILYLDNWWEDKSKSYIYEVKKIPYDEVDPKVYGSSAERELSAAELEQLSPKDMYDYYECIFNIPTSATLTPFWFNCEKIYNYFFNTTVDTDYKLFEISETRDKKQRGKILSEVVTTQLRENTYDIRKLLEYLTSATYEIFLLKKQIFELLQESEIDEARIDHIKLTINQKEEAYFKTLPPRPSSRLELAASEGGSKHFKGGALSYIKLTDEDFESYFKQNNIVPSPYDDHIKFGLDNFNIICYYFKLLNYYENIVCFNKEEYDNNYNKTYKIEIRNTLDIPILFKLMIEDFIDNKFNINYSLLEYYINNSGTEYIELKNDFYYIINSISSYNEIEYTSIYTEPTEEENIRNKKYFDNLFEQVIKKRDVYTAFIVSNKPDIKMENEITMYCNRFFCMNIIANLNTILTEQAKHHGLEPVPIPSPAAVSITSEDIAKANPKLDDISPTAPGVTYFKPELSTPVTPRSVASEIEGGTRCNKHKQQLTKCRKKNKNTKNKHKKYIHRTKKNKKNK